MSHLRDGTKHNEFYETMVFTEAGDVTNAEEQRLSAVHHVQKVQRISRVLDMGTIHAESNTLLSDTTWYECAGNRCVCGKFCNNFCC